VTATRLFCLELERRELKVWQVAATLSDSRPNLSAYQRLFLRVPPPLLPR
jgi:hypothetical protein